MTQAPSSSRAFLVRAVAVVLLGLALLRLYAWVGAISTSTIQMDFAAFYTAGQSLNHGYNPYENNIAKDPPAWDGLAAYRHSRFLYPPLVATLFRPLAMLPYSAAKAVWTWAALAAALATMLLARRAAALKSLDLFLISCAGAASFFPLLCNLDRGQIDLFTLLLITIAVTGLGARPRAAGFGAGAALALVTLLKLHALLFLPLLILRRRWDALAGMIAGGLALGILSLALNGRAAIEDYLRVQLPRIAEHGESGPDDLLLPLDVLRAHADPAGRLVKDGRVYVKEAVRFFPNATLVRPLGESAVDAGLAPGRSALSLSLYGAGLIGIALIVGFRSPGPRPPGREELAFWTAGMALVMLTSPLTWTMNVVWLLPALPLALACLSGIASLPLATGAGAALLLLGYVAAWLPDAHAYDVLRPLAALDEIKYVVAEALVLIGAAILVRRSITERSAGAPAPSVAPATS